MTRHRAVRSAARQDLAGRLDAAAAGLEDSRQPLDLIDLDAVEANAADLRRRAGGVPMRVASKSIRVTAVLRGVLAW